MMQPTFDSLAKTISSCTGIIAGLSLIMLFSGCSETKPTPQPPRPVRATTVHYQHALATARYSGEVRLRYEPPLSFQVTGKISQRLANVGDWVVKGQLLATLEPADYQLNRSGTNARLLAAQAELRQARRDLEHQGNLLEKDLASPASYERKKNAFSAAQARVAEAEAALDLNARRSDYTELRADHAGVVTAVEAEAGQVVSPGQTIIRLGRTEEKEVAINVPENRLDDLRSASSIKISLWAKPGIFHVGRVREISPGVDALIRTFSVKVSILDKADDVRMGMTATVHVQRSARQPVARLPLTAIAQEGEQPVVWVIDPSTESVQPREVTVSGYEDEYAGILDGVKTGERVVTAGVHKLLPGQKVRILGEEKP